MDDPRTAGVRTKMISQQSAFLLANLETDIITTRTNELIIFKTGERISSHHKGIKLAPLRHTLFYHRLCSLVPAQDYDFLYLRYSLITPFFIQFLKKVKKTNSGIQILLELPTFPFAKEYRGFFLKSIYWISELLARRYLPSLIDRIVVYGEQSKIYQIPTIKIRNGMDLSKLPLKEKKKRGEKLKLIATGRWAYWHGLDRILMGLGKHFQISSAPNVEMTIIGDGPELKKIKKLSRKLSLHSTVKFIGPLKAGELDFYFDEADIAVGSLGAHRKDLDIVSSLKHREYAARGIPFILSDWDPDFPKDLPWVRYFPNDESSIDIDEVIKFFDSISDSGTNANRDIRKYAELNLAWPEKLKPVINYLLSVE